MLTSAPICCAIGTAIGIMMPNVPQDVPVEKATKQLIRKMRNGAMPGDSHDCVISAT